MLLTPLGALITGTFGVAGVVPTNEAITAIVNGIPDVAQNIAFAMFIGVVASLVIARLTPLRYVFLTGHHMLFMATVLTVVLYNAHVEPVVQILVAAFGLATMMVIMPDVHDAVDEEGDRQSASRHGPLRLVRVHRRGRYRSDRRPRVEEHRGDAVPAGPPLPARPIVVRRSP